MAQIAKKYAEGTKVTVPRSREEIEKLLKSYGATGFAFGYDTDVAAILFQLKDPDNRSRSGERVKRLKGSIVNRNNQLL